MSTYRTKDRCLKCTGVLFVSDDPGDVRGETYCLSGHRFLPDHFIVIRDVVEEGKTRRRAPSQNGVKI